MEPNTIKRFMGRDEPELDLEQRVMRALGPQPDDLVEIPNEDRPEDEVLDIRLSSY